VIDVGPDGFSLVEVAQGVNVAQIIAATDAPLHIPDTELPTF